VAAFKLIINDKVMPDYQANINQYKDSLMAILKPLTNINVNQDIFSATHIDIRRHPHIWSKTNRVGNTSILVNDQAVKSTSTYELLHAELSVALKKLSRFRSHDRAERKAINVALEELEKLQEKTNREYLVYLRKMTTNMLLKAVGSDDLKEKINKIADLDIDDIKTSTKCLEQSRRVNALRNELIKHDNSLRPLANQLSIVTKRWIDPYYEKPLELNNIEKARRIAKSVIINIAELLAIAALILFFVFPPASLPVGIAASIGMLPILDGMFEVARNFWNGRSPTKRQLKELGIAVFIVFALTFCAYAVAAIGLSIIQQAPYIATKMIQFGTFMATTFMRFIDVTLNTLGSIIDGVEMKEIFSRKKPETAKKTSEKTPEKTPVKEKKCPLTLKPMQAFGRFFKSKRDSVDDLPATDFNFTPPRKV